MMINDMHELKKFGIPKMPKLKGHIKLRLYDHITGENEVVEGDNIVTDAIADIMANNYLGGINYSNIWSTDGIWKKWFGGVLAFQSAHANLDADKYYIPSNSNNILVAHAGQTTIDVEHDDDSLRGNPVPSDYIQTSNSVKIVWEWGRNKGNGTIRSLGLCHTDVGDAGLGSANYAFQNFSPFDIVNGSNLTNINASFDSGDNLLAQYDDNHGIGFIIGDGTDSGDEGWYSGHTLFETDKLTVYIRRLPYEKVGLFETLYADTSKEDRFTIDDLPFNLYSQPCFYFEPSTKYLWIFTNVTGISGYAVSWDNQNVKYCKIDTINKRLVNMGTEQLPVYYKTIISDNEDLPPLSYHRRASSMNFRYASIIVDGDYVYLPSTSGVAWGAYWDGGENMNINGFKKIHLSTGVNSEISLTENMNHFKPMIKQGDFFVCSGMVVNDEGYPCANLLDGANANSTYGTWGFQELNKSSFLAIPNRNTSSASSTPRYILANKMLLTTKYNLDQAVQKDANKSMIVEYTLTEVSS